MTTRDIIFTNVCKLRRENLVQFISEANKFSSTITVANTTHQINAKSLLGLMALEIKEGTELILSADGADENLAVDKLAEYLR